MNDLTVGGLPGTGTSTLCRLLEEATELRYVYAGRLFRDEAERRGLSLADFGALCEQDPSVDQALDAQQIELLRSGGVLLEGRLSGWLAHQQQIPALKVWITCDDEERFRRLAERDGGEASTQAALARTREASEAARYQAYYGADLEDLTIYDLVLDSTQQSPEALCDQVLAAWH